MKIVAAAADEEEDKLVCVLAKRPAYIVRVPCPHESRQIENRDDNQLRHTEADNHSRKGSRVPGKPQPVGRPIDAERREKVVKEGDRRRWSHPFEMCKHGYRRDQEKQQRRSRDLKCVTAVCSH